MQTHTHIRTHSLSLSLSDLRLDCLLSQKSVNIKTVKSTVSGAKAACVGLYTVGCTRPGTVTFLTYAQSVEGQKKPATNQPLACSAKPWVKAETAWPFIIIWHTDWLRSLPACCLTDRISHGVDWSISMGAQGMH